MIAINKSEKEIMLKHFPTLSIARTMKQDSKRHHYYMPEEPAAMRLLRKIRGEDEGKRNNRNKYRG